MIAIQAAHAQSETEPARSAMQNLLPSYETAAKTTTQDTPSVIPALSADPDPDGMIGTLNLNGPTMTGDSAFFLNLGSNGRTCFSCHQPGSGWGLSAVAVRRAYSRSKGNAPIFRLIDGAVCPTADASSSATNPEAYRLLLDKALFRIGLPVPTGAEFRIVTVDDPYGCNTNPVTGLTSPRSGMVSVYRRPLPSTNLDFVNTIMWDGREASLESQAIDATVGHAQAATPPTPSQITQIVAFERGLLTAQSVDIDAGSLSADGAAGGPASLAGTLAAFFPGINDPLGANPKGTPFTSMIFDLYASWSGLPGAIDAARAQVQRGQTVFNTKPVAITGVTGLNDVLGAPVIAGFCGTCHDSPNIGNHSVKLPINIGTTNAGPFDPAAGTGAPAALDIAGLPVFTIRCDAGPLQGSAYTVTDPGRAMISGKCADIGKIKGPVLRGLAARAPYFHNGAARTLDDVVTFYQQRFSIDFNDQEKADLVAFLKTL